MAAAASFPPDDLPVSTVSVLTSCPWKERPALDRWLFVVCVLGSSVKEGPLGWVHSLLRQSVIAIAGC